MGSPTGTTALLAETERTLPDQPAQLGLDGIAAEAPRGPGRPPGRRNVRTVNVAQFIRDSIGDPLLELAKMAMEGTEAKAKRLGIRLAEAEVEKRLALIAVLPFTDQRQAIAVDMTNRNVVHLTIADHAPEAVQIEAGPVLRADLAEIVEVQPLSDDDADAV